MKKLVALPLAVLFAAACSESTAPAKSADLNPSYAKPVSGPVVTPATGTAYTDSYDFNSVTITAQTHSGIGSDTPDGIGASANTVNFVPADGSNGFIGRYNNTATRSLVSLTQVAAKYTIDFDLYIIGSWDGKGKQAQNGNFLANVFQAAYRCSPTGAVVPMFTTTFSNQLTVQQDYPLAYPLGGNKAGTGATAIDALGYRNRPDLSNTPTFRSFGDATYHFSFTIDNTACGTAAPTFVFSSTAPGQQSNYDESWGIDNVVIKADN